MTLQGQGTAHSPKARRQTRSPTESSVTQAPSAGGGTSDCSVGSERIGPIPEAGGKAGGELHVDNCVEEQIGVLHSSAVVLCVSDLTPK